MIWRRTAPWSSPDAYACTTAGSPPTARNRSNSERRSPCRWPLISVLALSTSAARCALVQSPQELRERERPEDLVANAADRIARVLAEQAAQGGARQDDGCFGPRFLHEAHERAQHSALLRLVHEQDLIGISSKSEAVEQQIFELGKVAAVVDRGTDQRIPLQVDPYAVLRGLGQNGGYEGRLADLPCPIEQEHRLVGHGVGDEPCDVLLLAARNVRD